MDKIKKYIGEILTIVGVGLFSYNVFNFSHITGPGSILEKYGILGLTELRPEQVAYHYTSDTLLLISIGTMLIVSGILIIRSKT